MVISIKSVAVSCQMFIHITLTQTLYVCTYTYTGLNQNTNFSDSTGNLQAIYASQLHTHAHTHIHTQLGAMYIYYMYIAPSFTVHVYLTLAQCSMQAGLNITSFVTIHPMYLHYVVMGVTSWHFLYTAIVCATAFTVCNVNY